MTVNSGISTGDTLILQESANNTSIAPSSNTNKADERLSVATEPSSNLNNTLTQETINELSGILMKHIVAADNSCLFTSINFVLSGKVDESGEAAKYLRKLVAETILNERHNYDEAILGKPLEQYCSWIQNDTSWGGAIELAILSNFYGIEIAVVDTVNAIINRFGEDQNYPLRVFLMFDGIHYDPLFLEPFDVSVYFFLWFVFECLVDYRVVKFKLYLKHLMRGCSKKLNCWHMRLSLVDNSLMLISSL